MESVAIPVVAILVDMSCGGRETNLASTLTWIDGGGEGSADHDGGRALSDLERVDEAEPGEPIAVCGRDPRPGGGSS
ncbi:MAG: mercuric reductase [Acidimicrobiales bacterium]